MLAAILLFGCASAPTPKSGDQATSTEYTQAVAKLEAGDLDEARKALLQMTREYPDLAGPYANLGLLYQRQGDNKAAAAAFDTALALKPDSGRIYNAAALFYRSVGRFADAEAAYLRAIRYAPDFADPLLNLAILYDLYLDRPAQAIKYYRRYLAMSDKSDKQVKLWLADAQRRAGVVVGNGK